MYRVSYTICSLNNLVRGFVVHLQNICPTVFLLDCVFCLLDLNVLITSAADDFFFFFIILFF